MATSNNRISNLITSQVPFFVRNDHPKFIQFLEAYYRYLEQSGKAVNVAENIPNYFDVDKTEEEFVDKLYDEYLKGVPKKVLVDKALLLKHVKDFYLAKGSEKSIRFLLNILYNQEDINIYYPKKDVLRASDGKWYVQKSLRINELKINDTANNSLVALEKFAARKVYGNTSNAFATVERVDRFFEAGTQIDELVLSNIRGTFTNGEIVYAIFEEGEELTSKSVVANVFGGIINTVQIDKAGSSYVVGDHPVITTNGQGSGGDVVVSQVSQGNIQSVVVLSGGAGYRVSDSLLFSGGGGTGANANVFVVLADNSVHPNSYNIIYSQIYLEQDTAIGNTIYANLVASVTDPANNWISNSMNTFVYANTGPAYQIKVISAGSGYTSLPSISIVANNRIKELGVLGRMEIVNGGLGYQIGDTITFTNIPGGYGVGAAANVTNVAANGRITSVKFVEVPGHIIGGAGYSSSGIPKYPMANVISANANASGANIAVTALLGDGGSFLSANSTIGAIEKLTILSKGTNYSNGNTFLDFTGIGDGTAQASVRIIEGAYTYPGRYLNDDGFLSSYNFLQDRDYYQEFSYVIRSKTSIDKYRKVLRELVHPSGMKVFGNYLFDDMNPDMIETSSNAVTENVSTVKSRTYLISNNAIINYTSHGFSVNDEVAIQFTSGNIANYAANISTYSPNGIYKVANVIDSNTFTVFSGKYLPGSINVNILIGETNPTDIYMKEDGYDLFFIGTTNDRVFNYKLRRQYDITSSYLYKRSPSLASQEGSASGLTFKPDGTIFYIIGTTNDRIIQYNMSEAWNVNTATLGLSFNANSTLGITNPQALQISRDGRYMYFADNNTDVIYQLQLSEAWNVNTASYLTQRNVITFDSTVTGLYFNSNGTSMFLGGQSNDRVKEFRLSTAWNVNTATIYANSAGFTAFSPAMQGLAFANNGSMLYITDSTYDLIHQLPMTEAWNVNTAFNGTTTTGNLIVGRVV
jgi:hypothetical protein